MSISPRTYYTKPLPGVLLNRLAPINYGLVGWWPFSEGSGPLFHDISVLAPQTATRWRVLGAGGWGGSQSGRSFVFDGAVDFAQVPGYPTPAASMSVVVHLNAVMGGGPTQHLISQSAPDSFESFSWHISTLGGGSHFNVLLSDDGTLAPGHHKSYFSNGNFVALDNTWHTLGFTFHAPTSTLKLYVDGRENIGASKEFDDAITSINPETSLNFANDLNSVRHWAGSLDDVKIYDRALSGREMHILNVNPYLGLQT